MKSQQSLKLRFLNYVSLRFFEMPLQKNVKSRVFLDFQKKRKKRILKLCIGLPCEIISTRIDKFMSTLHLQQ